jgi:hypothetical protein
MVFYLVLNVYILPIKKLQLQLKNPFTNFVICRYLSIPTILWIPKNVLDLESSKLTRCIRIPV